MLEQAPTSLDHDGPLKRICPSLRCSPPPTAPSSPLGTSRGAQATSPLWRPLKVRDTSGFLPSELLQVADIVHVVRDAQRFPPRVSISCPCLYGLIRSCLHARGCCELSSASAGYMSLPSRGRSEWGRRFGIPLDMFHPASSVGLPPYLDGPAGSVALDSSYDPFRLYSPICSQPPTPRFNGVLLTAVNSANEASVLQQEVSSLLLKGAIEEVPSSDLNRGFFSWYFLVPKKDGGLRPILDLRRLNYSLYRGKFRMLTLKSILSQVQEGDWFVTVDLKDAYFHIQVVQRHRKFLRFAFGGKACQYKVLPFGLALAPRTFTKCMDAALAPAEAPGHPDPQLPG